MEAQKQLKPKKEVTPELTAKRAKRNKRIVLVLHWIMMTMLIASSVYALVMAILAPKVSVTDDMTKSNYMLMLFQSILGIVVLLLPGILAKRMSITIPIFMEIVIIVFVYAAIFLGEVQFFYHKYEHWDTVLHTFSGVMFGIIGFSLINILNSSNRVSMQLKPLFVALFAFCFALAIVTVWEIYEFCMDQFFGFDMQKFLPEGMTVGSNLTEAQLIELGKFYASREGYRFALMDTMMDLVVDFIGALAVSVFGFISLKLNKGWLQKTLIGVKEKPLAAEAEAQTEASGIAAELAPSALSAYTAESAEGGTALSASEHSSENAAPVINADGDSVPVQNADKAQAAQTEAAAAANAKPRAKKKPDPKI